MPKPSPTDDSTEALLSRIEGIEQQLATAHRVIQGLIGMVAHNTANIFCNDIELGRRGSTRYDAGSRRFSGNANLDVYRQMKQMAEDAIRRGEVVP